MEAVVHEGACASDSQSTVCHASDIIVPFLLARSAEFRILSDLRRKGWENPKGDSYFRSQRRNADSSSEKNAKYFYKLMRAIGEEIHQATNAFWVPRSDTGPPKILDMCMAPGGFLETAMNKNPRSEALAFSLPTSCGGHKSRLPKNLKVDQRFLDINMLAADMGANTIPSDHPEAKMFLKKHLKQENLFDLVICDGQVLRTHVRPDYREKSEARRLTVTQLALGLTHVRTGGTMIVLLHKLEAWDTANLVFDFWKFSSVRLLKPQEGHAKRSSFYLVATKIQTQHPHAIKTIEKWKHVWQVSTFGSTEELKQLLWKDRHRVEEFLSVFGKELVDLGREIWRVQSDALAKANFTQ
ncbi:hypothetical protein N7512_007526 [Penicillium capsulatum]|nr:hypothetical protein N7512_007526 [Penicillium capsulatum]